ncbi:sialate O-acetylesterase [Terriglobus albidus]|uniref:sialate O-acetylesterase n=1 Tax=Terriglobus albidus TaxID=1592106 RepID=UPI0021E053D4|nr:sialate O-acetylesterase [Terriglobus albidus]
MNSLFRNVLLVAIEMLLSLSTAIAQPADVATAHLPFVSPIFGDNMVLQRDKVNSVWGWSEPGDRITVQIGDVSVTATAGADRKWTAMITPPAVGGPYTMKVMGKQVAELKNIMVGDVWLCSGQSNMEFMMRQVKNADQELKAANYPDIRFFVVAQRSGYHLVSVPSGSWQVVTPETAGRLSAVAYFFSRRLEEELHVPIGLVVDAVGGTPAETWMSVAALHELKDFEPPLAELKKMADEGLPEYGNYVSHWYDRYDIGKKEGWQEPAFDDSGWATVTLKSGFRDLGVADAPSVVYFRKEFTLPETIPAQRATVRLGVVEKMDTVWVNGQTVGGSSWVENPRNYFLRPGVLKPGKNQITIRVLKTLPDGGFTAMPEDLKLQFADNTTIPFSGPWKGKVSVDARPPFPLPNSYQNWPVIPSVLFNGMIEPLTPLAITGALWYQGEANSERAYEYRKVMPALIADWRRAFHQGDFPFYIVSLPAFKARSEVPVEDSWAETREAQAGTVAAVPNTCLAVTIDTGEADNIHPKDKAPVGDRLARCALAKQYGKPIVYQGPTVDKVEKQSGAIRLHFIHAEGGLVVKGDHLGQFQIAGDDHQWMWADAHISGDYIIVSTSLIQNPVAVRYAWQANPVATLFNGAGLPAAPFRTDNWKGITEGRQPY